MNKKRVHVWISGRVQGVFFRAYAREEALKEGLEGWVQNLPDGRVEAVFQGPEEAVERILKWCHRGSPMSRVEHVEVLEEPIDKRLVGFTIRY